MDRKKTCAGYWLLKQELLTTDSVNVHGDGTLAIERKQEKYS
jgi:hypothetical protein